MRLTRCSNASSVIVPIGFKSAWMRGVHSTSSRCLSLEEPRHRCLRAAVPVDDLVALGDAARQEPIEGCGHRCEGVGLVVEAQHRDTERCVGVGVVMARVAERSPAGAR